MTNEKLNTNGFIFSSETNTIQPITYRDYLCEYGKDETTTPHGIGDRMHIREVQDDEGNVIEWQVWTWGANGNNPRYTGTSFDNAEDADLYYYERCEWFISEKNWDAPRWFENEYDAIQDMADSLERSPEVIIRYLSLSRITARKEAEHRAEITRQYEKRKAWLSVEVPKEADSITIDEDFKQAIKWAGEAAGKEKSDRMASAIKGLLSRNGIAEIKTDFWQVARILKDKAK